MNAVGKPRPLPRGEERTWYEGAAQGQLLIQRCTACGRAIFYPRAVCPQCHAPDPAWIAASGGGTLHSYSVLHRAGTPGWEADVPYVVALIDLDEGVRVMGNVLDAVPSTVRIGMRVHVTFQDRGEGLVVPQWTPDAESAS